MSASRQRTLDGIVALLQAQGITLDELQRHLAATEGDMAGMTLGAFLADELNKLSDNTRRTYRTSLQRLVDGVPRTCDCDCRECCDVEGGCVCECRRCRTSALQLDPFGDRTLGSIGFQQLETAVVLARRIAHKRGVAANRERASQGRSAKPVHGKGAAETAVRAYRWLFHRARLAGHVTVDPAVDLKVPRRSASRRRALTGAEIVEFFDAVASGGDDPELDTLMCWFHAETGARREGGINLRCGDLHDRQQMIRLNEKFDTERDQPVSLELILALRTLAISRGGDRCDPTSQQYDPELPVFWYRPRGKQPARQLTGRRYDTLFRRTQATLPWADAAGFTAHGLRHTSGTLVERLAGTQVARRFLGHADRTVTDSYTDADLTEVARAVSQLTGRPHPLAEVDEFD